MFYDGNSNYANLACVGRNVPIGPRNAGMKIPCLCVSNMGRIALIVQDPYRNGESDDEFIDKVSNYIIELRKWDSEILDGVACDYFYRTEGHAARAYDILAYNGYVRFMAEDRIAYKIDDGLQVHDILVIVAVDSDSIDMRRVEFANGKVGKSGLLLSLVDSRQSETFFRYRR